MKPIKNDIMIKKKNFLVALFVATATLFTACSDDDDGTTPVIGPTGTIMVENQTLMDRMVTVSNVEISDDGWLLIYRNNAGILGTEILGYTHIESGSHQDVTVELDEDLEISSGEVLWAALHVDENDNNQLDWDGFTGVDIPVRSGDDPVAESFIVTIESNSVTAADQAISDDNSITVSNVLLEEAGWIVVHNDNDEGPGEEILAISGLITAGSHDNVEIEFEDSAEVNVGDKIWIMLHTDTGTAGVYEFNGGANGFDLPVLGADNKPVMTSITITE